VAMERLPADKTDSACVRLKRWAAVGGSWSAVGGSWSAVGGSWSAVGGSRSATVLHCLSHLQCSGSSGRMT